MFRFQFHRRRGSDDCRAAWRWRAMGRAPVGSERGGMQVPAGLQRPVLRGVRLRL